MVPTLDQLVIGLCGMIRVCVTGASHGLARSETRSLVLLESRSLERSGFAITGGEHGREELKGSDQISDRFN